MNLYENTMNVAPHKERESLATIEKSINAQKKLALTHLEENGINPFTTLINMTCVQDYINEKIPSQQRSASPILTSGDIDKCIENLKKNL